MKYRNEIRIDFENESDFILCVPLKVGAANESNMISDSTFIVNKPKMIHRLRFSNFAHENNII